MTPAPLPQVSAVIAHYGAIERTQLLVQDLKAQSASQVEIIVTDDASPNPYPHQDGVTVIRHKVNSGFGTAINTGASHARGDWLLLLNNDVRLEPDFVANALERAYRWQPAVCGFRQMTARGVVPPSGPFPTFWGTLGQHSDALAPIARRLGIAKRWQLDDPHRSDEFEVDWIGGAALLLPRSEFNAVGGFDPGFYMYNEEIDLQRRLRDRGVRSVVLGGISIFHEGGATTTSMNITEERLRSRLLYEDIAYGPKRRRALGWGLQMVLSIDTVYHRLMGLTGDGEEAVHAARQRRSALRRALKEKVT